MRWDDLDGHADMLGLLRPADATLAAAIERSAALELHCPALEVCRLLEVLAGERAIERVLEVGRGLGASTISLSRGAASAAVLSVDASGEHLAETAELLRNAGVEGRVSLLTEAPLAVVGMVEGRFDHIHLAVDIGEALRLADRLLPKLAVGGLLTVDGIRPLDSGDRVEERARAVSGYLVMHPQLEALVLPIGEGLLVARKKALLVTEMGGPF